MKIWDFDSMSADDLVSFANQVTTVLGKGVSVLKLVTIMKTLKVTSTH